MKATSYRATYFGAFAGILESILNDPQVADEKDLRKLSADTLSAHFKVAYQGTVLQSGFFADCAALLEARKRYESSFLYCFDTAFIASFETLKQQRGILTYDDMILDLDRALSRSPRLKRQLQQRYRAALVDEFQDTDGRQYAIFKTVFGGEPEDGRFFAMIGDPKQSIYGFRGADIAAYLQARKAVHHAYTLPTNYRSEKGMVAGVNAFFEGADLGLCSAAMGAIRTHRSASHRSMPAIRLKSVCALPPDLRRIACMSVRWSVRRMGG